MQLKCITGPCDGMHIEVRNDLRANEHWNVMQKPTKFLREITSDPISVNYHPYKMELYRGPRGEELKFLIPVETDSWDFFVKRILHGK